MKRFWVHRLRGASFCLALLLSVGAVHAQSSVPAPRDVLSPTPMGEAPGRVAPVKPADAIKPPSAATVPSPSQLTAPSQQNPPTQKSAAAPVGGTAAVQSAPPDQPAQKAEPKPKKKAAAPARETALSDDPTPVFQPETYFATVKAADQYARIVDAGGWPAIAKPLNPRSKGKEVAALRQRLAAEGDLEGADGAGEKWDAALTAAVKHFQFRYGLKQTGIVAGATLKALNVPAEERLKQLSASAQRIADVRFPFGERYVVVNIPSAAVDAVENGQVVRRYAAVVGDVEHRSPEIEAKISAINLNPTWTVPVSIIKNEIIPKMRQNPKYLSKAKIRILDGKGREIDPGQIDWSTEKAANYTLRQDSGAGNSLGSIRISMPNKLAVYMHDTPSKRLFSADYRFLSHGCVRVEGVYDLAAWLLEGAGGSPAGTWDKLELLQKIASGEREDIKLARAVPVIWVYMTGWASADGTVHFRDDVYGIDGESEQTTAQIQPAATTR
ncbi:MAG: L,D-transpeptidase YcbB [Methylobacteriaceae bacterium]|nr:L,D-transpeptidase YcbB [Methylobacteriaceae bacterium]